MNYNHFCNDGEHIYAGKHLLIDIYNGKNLDNISIIEKAFNQAISDCGATLLHIHFHHFSDGCGVSGVAILQESHISIHSWYECGYAAIDVFLCGGLNPEDCVPSLKKAFETDDVIISTIKRGVVRTL